MNYTGCTKVLQIPIKKKKDLHLFLLEFVMVRFHFIYSTIRLHLSQTTALWERDHAICDCHSCQDDGYGVAGCGMHFSLSQERPSSEERAVCSSANLVLLALKKTLQSQMQSRFLHFLIFIIEKEECRLIANIYIYPKSVKRNCSLVLQTVRTSGGLGTRLASDLNHSRRPPR